MHNFANARQRILYQVVCDILENSKTVWVMPISKVKTLIEVAINEEFLQKQNEG